MTCHETKPRELFSLDPVGDECNRCRYFIARAQYEGRCVGEIGTCPAPVVPNGEVLNQGPFCADHRAERVRRLRATARKFSDMYPELADWAGVS
ncbi:hypothetical protein [Streptomyces sp. enrichment culture]|uniref:hypothetical protein n=1 Tax=Streptomyces sp. enrichment culture TaxID=1795815 RepID=UPI003F5614CE